MAIPLSEQLRPKEFSAIVGQQHLLGPKGILSSIIKSGKPLSIILWGPPGCGKTSIARLYAQAFNMRFESLSAIWSGIADLKRILSEIEQAPLFGKSILLFVDEIHRFNKTQQDAFLPLLENGTIVLVGATAENPSFYLNQALLSRVRLLPLKALDERALDEILKNTEKQQRPLKLDVQARKYLIQLSQGDGRYLLNLIESIYSITTEQELTAEELQTLLQKRPPLSDKDGDQHYNLISALHKSIRGSDPDASLYWFNRMLEAGQSPLFIARRLIRMACEDIGLADPQALSLAIAARNAYEILGSPEGELALAQTVVYLALAPKSNAIYKAFVSSKEAASQTGHLAVPARIINASNKTMKALGHGHGYQYDHDTIQGFSGQNYFPDQLKRECFYEPVERGFERDMKKRIEYFSALRKKLQSSSE